MRMVVMTIGPAIALVWTLGFSQQAVQAPPGVKVLRDLAYMEGGHERNKLDLYLPEQSGEALPLIIWVHGGAWRGGSKEQCPAIRFVARGYVVASINYRLSQHAIFPAQIEDCKAAVSWLRAHAKEYRIAPNRFGVWGASAGGHLVALLGTTGGVKEFEKRENHKVSSRVQAVCDFFGPTDFVQMDAHAIAGANLKHDAAGSPESLLIGGPIQENKDKVARADPITYASKDDAPFLIVHGDRDPLVPYHQSEILDDALRKAGVEAKLHIIPGAGHGGPQFASTEVATMVSEFFDRHLRRTPHPSKS